MKKIHTNFFEMNNHSICSPNISGFRGKNFQNPFSFEKSKVGRSDMLSSYTHKKISTQTCQQLRFLLCSDFEKICTKFFKMNNHSICSSNIFGFQGENFQDPFILKRAKLGAQICRVAPLTFVRLYCTHRSLVLLAGQLTTTTTWWVPVVGGWGGSQ